MNLALEVSHKLATHNTYSKVISVPCQEIFFRQKESYKNKILNETKYKISIEAGRSDTWSKFIGENGMSFGIEEFGKSAPYKDIFKDFKLTASEISNKTKIKDNAIPPKIEVPRTTFSKYETVSLPGVILIKETEAFLNCSEIFSGSQKTIV